jgi:peptidoglycan/LPS O-acetylase OafA/YrhL
MTGGRRPSYRADIDGLRAIAVFAVIAFHLRSRWLTGGFVGVDVFFVVSGYVVCHSIAGHSEGSTLSALREFYARRVKRLLPGLLACLLVVSAAFALLTAPFPVEHNNATYRTGLSALVGLSNLYLNRLSLNYFDGDAVPNPFTHTWSLSVEEQFYLTYPLLVFLIKRERLLLGITLVLSAASLWLSARWSVAQPTLAYFAMPSRYWELGAGCSLALLERLGSFDRLARNAWVLPCSSALGVALLGAAFVFTQKTGFPFPGALWTVAGTAALIVGGLSRESALVRVLSSAPLVQVGKLSYSIYLWHWPAVTLAMRLGVAGTWRGNAAVLVTTALASVASYHLIEAPVRLGSRRSAKQVLITALISVVAMGGLIEGVRLTRWSFYLGAHQDWTHDWNTSPGQPYVGDALRARDCHLPNSASVPAGMLEACLARSRPPAGRILYTVGDSHAYSDWNMVKAGVDAGLYDLYALSRDGCPVQPAVDAPGDGCAQYWRHVRELLSDRVRRGDLVLLATLLRAQPVTQSEESGMRSLAQLLADRGATLVIQAPLPVQGTYAFDCVPSWFAPQPDGCYKSRSQDLDERAPALRVVTRLASSATNIAVWDPYDLLCPTALCSPFLGNRPLYRDDDHLSLFGSAYLGPHFVSFLRQKRLVD